MVLKDPVCGMTVTSHSFHHLEHMGQVHYFCGVECKAQFANHTLRYTHAGASQAAQPTDVLSLQRLKGHAAWIYGLSLAAVLALLGRWLV